MRGRPVRWRRFGGSVVLISHPVVCRLLPPCSRLPLCLPCPAPASVDLPLSPTKLNDASLFPENTFNDAMTQFQEEYPEFAKYGWGPSVHAEKWNGRHAMFGWVFICATAYAKGHGLIPDPEATLNLKQWGTLATISGKNTITNERAIILIANVHFLFLSVCAALCPPPFGDQLLLEPDEMDKEPYGMFPDYKDSGITETAEMVNGRLAMIGLIALLGQSAISGQSMIDVVNTWVGGAYF